VRSVLAAAFCYDGDMLGVSVLRATGAAVACMICAACSGRLTDMVGTQGESDAQPDGPGSVVEDAGLDATLDASLDSTGRSDVATADAPTEALDAPAEASAEWSEPLVAILSRALITDHAGNVLAVGEGEDGPLVVKAAPDGQILWMPPIAANGQDMVTGVAVDSADNIIISGMNATGTVDLGGGARRMRATFSSPESISDARASHPGTAPGYAEWS
jgi:hypothetical protein